MNRIGDIKGAYRIESYQVVAISVLRAGVGFLRSNQAGLLCAFRLLVGNWACRLSQEGCNGA